MMHLNINKNRLMLTELSIVVRLKKKPRRSMVMVFKLGQMVLTMKAAGKMVCSLVKASTSTRMETSMKASGKTIKLMDTVSTNMPMDLFMKANGIRITKKDLAEKYGMMVVTIQVTTVSQPSKATVIIIGKTVIPIWETGTRIKLMDKASLSGLINEFTQETGTMVRSMELAHTSILIRDSIMVNIRTIKSRAMVAISMEMVELILVTGPMANRMVKVI